MATKDPVLLVVLMETASFRWDVAGISLAGEPVPLLRSEPGNLQTYVGLEFDEQVSFLRHRLSNVLQRACDRLWGRQMKPCAIVFLADGRFVQAASELTARVAEHFVEWMASPPVAFFLVSGGFDQTDSLVLDRIAGQLDASHAESLQIGLPAILTARSACDAWELVAYRSTWQRDSA